MKTRNGNGFASKLRLAQKGHKIWNKRQSDEPLTEGQAKRLSELIATLSTPKPAATGTLRRSVTPATVWRSSFDGRIMEGF